MAKVCPKKETSNRKQSRRFKPYSSRKEYVKAGAVAHQLRHTRTASSSTTKLCTDLGKKRVLVSEKKKPKTEPLLLLLPHNDTPVMSPERILLTPMPERFDQLSQTKSPKTPGGDGDGDGDRDEDHSFFHSTLESLPMDLLVIILCYLHHDQLRPVFHVSRKIRKAVILARQYHFNYTTPDRARQEMLRTMTPLPTEHWPFSSKGHDKGIIRCVSPQTPKAPRCKRHGKDIRCSSPQTPKAPRCKGYGKGNRCSSPQTPNAPRHGPRPPSRYKGSAEVRQIAAVLFQETALTSRRIVPPGLPKPKCKSFASNRALFCEDELCQAVAQNKLL